MKATAFHLFCGLGGGGLGFKRAGFEGVGAIDFSEDACTDYASIVGEPATCGDLEHMTPADLRACSAERPDVLFTSPPCKGFSGCLPSKSAELEKYQRMNALTLRGLWLAMEAWSTPPALVLLENVPRIQNRGAEWLERIEAMLRGYGYATARSVHDCGELGGLAQHRRRFLLVARHQPQVPAYLRVPSSKRVRGIGEVLGELPVPVPGSTDGGPMHALPRLSALNWVRLALIPAGGDWRDLKQYPEVRLRERAARQNGPFGVEVWDEAAHAVLGHVDVRSTFSAIADPRVECKRREGGHGVLGWSDASAPVIGHPSIDNFPCQVADPRLEHTEHNGCRGVQRWDEVAATVRAHHNFNNANASVADPRLAEIGARHDGTLGVESWATPSHTVTAQHGRRGWDSVADPRVPEIVGPAFDIASKRAIHLVIRAADGTWHRPLTTLELAALQGFPVRSDAGEWLTLTGGSQRAWRERIGNAVPPPAAEAIANSCMATLALARDGGFTLDPREIWVREGMHA